MRSETFSMGRWHCYLLMLVEQAPWLAWTLAITVTALIATGFVLSPWIGVAAIGFAIFIVVMAMSFVIMTYGFHSLTGVNTTPHTLAIEGDDVSAEFEDGKSVKISKKALRPYRIYPGGVLVPVDGERKGWLWIPPKAFPDTESFKQFLTLLM